MELSKHLHSICSNTGRNISYQEHIALLLLELDAVMEDIKYNDNSEELEYHYITGENVINDLINLFEANNAGVMSDLLNEVDIEGSIWNYEDGFFNKR